MAEVAQMSVSSEFPVGMRVLVIDDDPTCLKVLEGLLLKCNYKVIVTSQATTGLSILKEKIDNIDIVIVDVHMPDMDGFKFLEIVGLEMDIPVIMMSVDDDVNNVMKGVRHGACDYLLKPIRLEELKNIWQHVIRKKLATPGKANASSNKDSSTVLDHPSRLQYKDHELEDRTDETTSNKKKQRVNWNKELHENFILVVHKLGGEEKAVPKKILDAMNIPGLTRENVASHLQKYRSALKKSKGNKIGDSYHRSKMISNKVDSISNFTLVPFEDQYPVIKNSYDRYRMEQCPADQYCQKVQYGTQSCDTFNQQYVTNSHMLPLTINTQQHLLQGYMRPPQLLTANPSMLEHTDCRGNLSGLNHQPTFASPSSYVPQTSSILQFPNHSTGCELGPGVVNNLSNVHGTPQNDFLHAIIPNFPPGYIENNGFGYNGYVDGNMNRQINDFNIDLPNEMMKFLDSETTNLGEDPPVK